MIDAIKVAQEKGEAFSTPASAGFFSRAEKAVEADGHAVLAAIENWYALHFHKATLAGVSPVSADDKAALVRVVTAAINPAKE